MHYWLLISLIAPLLWTIVNHIDKFQLSRSLNRSAGVGLIFLFSSLFSVFVLPVILYFDKSIVFSLNIIDILMLLGIGVLSAIGFLFYLLALDIEESSIVIPLLQMIPIFAYFLSYFILGEVLTKMQILAALIIILGIILLSLEFDNESHITVKKKVLLLIATSSFLFALHDTLFKAVALKDSFLSSTFWQYSGLTLTGIFVFTFSKKFRNEFKQIFRNNVFFTISLNTASEVLYIIGNMVNNFATLFAPVSLILVVTSVQPVFVFIGGTLLTIFLPKIATEKISKKHLLQKIISIFIILIGSYMLYYYA